MDDMQQNEMTMGKQVSGGCYGLPTPRHWTWNALQKFIIYNNGQSTTRNQGPHSRNFLGKTLGRFLIVRQCLTISGKTLTTDNFTLLTNSRLTTSRNIIQHDAKIKVLITIIIALLFPNVRLVLCQIFSYDFPKIRNLPKKFRECVSSSCVTHPDVTICHEFFQNEKQ